MYQALTTSRRKLLNKKGINMALQDIAQVSISLNTSGVSREGFGTPLFITAHNYFSDRVRSYRQASDVALDMTTESNAYKAAVSAFSNNPSVEVLKIGRIIASSDVSPDPSATTIGSVTKVTITDILGVFVEASYTTQEGDQLSDITSNLVSQINASDVDVVITNNGDSFKVGRNGTFPDADFTLSNLQNIGASASDDANVESILDAYTEIKKADKDFYLVSWENHSTLGGDDLEEGILDLAGVIESEQKLYVVGSSAQSTITTPFTQGNEPSEADDVLGFLQSGNFLRTIGWWHQDADSSYNELAYACYNLPFDAGSVVWANLKVQTSNARNAEGNALTATQEINLSNRNANWASVRGGIVYSREGKVVGGEWIDIIRGRDNLQSDLEADLFDLLTNQQGQKLPYTDGGINVIAGVVEKRLNSYKVDRQFLTDPITISVPKAADVSRSDKVSRTLRDLSFRAKLAGAIIVVEITGTLEV
jgi:hypothetical protein